MADQYDDDEHRAAYERARESVEFFQQFASIVGEQLHDIDVDADDVARNIGLDDIARNHPAYRATIIIYDIPGPGDDAGVDGINCYDQYTDLCPYHPSQNRFHRDFFRAEHIYGATERPYKARGDDSALRPDDDNHDS